MAGHQNHYRVCATVIAHESQLHTWRLSSNVWQWHLNRVATEFHLSWFLLRTVSTSVFLLKRPQPSFRSFHSKQPDSSAETFPLWKWNLGLHRSMMWLKSSHELSMSFAMCIYLVSTVYYYIAACRNLYDNFVCASAFHEADAHWWHRAIRYIERSLLPARKQPFRLLKVRQNYD